MAIRRSVTRRLPRTTMTNVDRYVVPQYKPAPKTDLQATPVHMGLGSSPSDPVNRKEPNQPSRPPASTVLAADPADGGTRIASFVSAAGVDSERAAATHLTFAQWFGPTPHVANSLDETGKTPATLTTTMSRYVDSLKTEALPMPRNAQSTLSDFARNLPTYVAEFGLGDEALAQQQWLSVQKAYTSALHLLDAGAFEAHLNACDAKVTRFFETGASGGAAAAAADAEGDDRLPIRQRLAAVADILRRDAVAKRNQEIDKLVAFASSAGLRGGQLVWTRFFSQVENLKAELLDSDTTAARYECCARQPLPAFRPSTALLFAVVTAARAQADAAASDEQSSARQLLLRGSADVLRQLTRDEVVRFAVPRLGALLTGDRADIKIFTRLGFHDAARAVAANLASVQTSSEARRAQAEAIVPLFHDKRAVETVIARILDGKNAGIAKQHIFKVLRTSNLSDGPAIAKALKALNWAERYQEYARELLADAAFLNALHATIQAETSISDKHRQRSDALVTDETKKFLADMLDADSRRAAIVRDSVLQIQMDVVETAEKDKVYALLEAHGVALDELVNLAADRLRASRAEAQVASDRLVAELVSDIARRNPHWEKAGIINAASDRNLKPDSAPALQLLLKIYLRAAYMPGVGQALLAKRNRGRIGPIATHADQVNIVGEVGFAEQYDMLDYKKYDWAGWYQRMNDVYNRNVSLRVKLDNMRILDNEGKPFIDHQTERRLRIVAGERVANGVFKLDNDRFEDRADNAEFAAVKFQDALNDAKKAQLGEEYWPSVEVKVRRPSGQTKLRYSTLDWDRVEAKTLEAFKEYAEKKKTAVFVPPTQTWLKIGGQASTTVRRKADDAGYTVDDLFTELEGDAAATPPKPAAQ